MRIFVSSILAISLLSSGLAGSAAQAADATLPPPVDPRGELRSIVPDDDAAKLDALLATLAQAGDDRAAADLDREIRALWAKPGDAATGLFLEWGGRAVADGEIPLALDLFDQAVAREPRLAEARFRRATAELAAGHMDRAVGDLKDVLTLEPRHYPAMRALAVLMASLDDNRRALALLKRARAINPHVTGLDRQIDELEKQSAGQPI